MKCGSCGFENREGKSFCVECGAALTRRCPACAAEVAADEKFCGDCGAALTGGPAPVVPAPSAVRKTVTVLFADLGGSTSFGERTEQEIARQVLARYLALLQETVEAHGGTVAKFTGDGVMAVFGVPEIAEDDARRAVDVGAALQERFARFAADVERDHGELLTMRVGINTGEVVIGEQDADLIGDAVNVAARLEKLCRPGQVLVAEETWRATRGDVTYADLGEVTVAGRTQSVAIFELVSTKRAEEAAAPFVGRDVEMARLLTVLDDARAASAARLTMVLGSPGVGKTRLAREFCARVDAQSVELRCDRAGGATFAPVAQLLREAAGLPDDADANIARDGIAGLLPDDEEDRARVADVLAGLIGAAPARSVEETFWAVRRVVEATAATRALVVVIDDIQWAEPLLLDLFEHLTEWVGGAAVLLVGLARPELRDVRPALTEPGRRVADVLVLDGLDASATEALAVGLLGAERLPAGLVERLPASTDGNPLFVRELMRMLVDDRTIRRRNDGEWELTIDAGALDVPPTIQSLLGARVERLPAAERAVLEYASVIGARFSLGALRELVADPTRVEALLESMRRKELVEPTGTYWGDEPVHRFHHVLIRDAAYRRLLKTTRAELHERVAVWTDRTAADLIGDYEAAIAYHYEQAYRYRSELSTLDERAHELGRRAAELLTTAARQALGRDDLAAAGALSARALALVPDSDAAGRADLLTMGCECLLASGDGAAARPLVEELSRVAGVDARLAAWSECFAAQLVGLTDPEGLVAADARARAAAETLAALGDGSGQAKAHQVRAGLLARLGRVGDAELELDHALAAARAADDRRRVTAVLGAAPEAALFGPSPVARAGGRCLDVVRVLRITAAAPSVEAASNRCQAVLESLRGRFDVSRSLLAMARAALEELGLRHGLAQTELYAGMVELVAGNPHAAIPPLRAAFGGMGALGVGADAGNAAALLARALLVDGAVDEADEMATASEQLAGQNLKTSIGWRVARAEVLAARGDFDGAVAVAERAVEIAAGTDLVIDHADACVALATVRARAGDASGARAARADARRLYAQKGATVLVERLDDGEPDAAPPSVATDPSGGGGDRLENMASRGTRRSIELLLAGRDDEVLAMARPDFTRLDRRHGVAAAPITNAVEYVASLRALTDQFGTISFEPIALRGETLHLSRVVWGRPDDFHVAILAVFEFDAAGQGTGIVNFDDDDLDAAMAELDARFAVVEGAAPDPSPGENTASRCFIDFAQTLNARDASGLRARMAPGFLSHSRRALTTVPTTSGEQFVQAAFDIVDVFDDARVETIAVRGDRVFLGRALYSTHDGFEVPNLIVGEVDGEGRALALVFFDEHDLVAAMQELEDRYRAGEGAVDA